MKAWVAPDQPPFVLARLDMKPLPCKGADSVLIRQ